MPPSPSSPARRPSKAREIWLVDKAPVVIDKLNAAKAELGQVHEVAGPRRASRKTWPTSRATTPAPPSSSISRKCSGSRPSSTNTPTSPPSKSRTIQTILPKDELNAFRGVYLETAQRLRAAAEQAGSSRRTTEVDQLDFEFVLFASAVIDYDYIMKLIADYSMQEAGQDDDEPRTAHRPDRVRRQVPRRARRHHRIRPRPQGRRGPRRNRHPRRLPAVQGRESCPRTGRPRRRNTACPQLRCKPSSTPSSRA